MASPSAGAGCSSPTKAGTLSVIDPESNEVSGPGAARRHAAGWVVAGKGVVWLAERRFGRRPALPGRGRACRDGEHHRRRPARGDLARQAAGLGRQRQRRHRQPDRPRVTGDRRRADRRRLPPDRDLRRPPLRLGHELGRRHGHADRPVDRGGRRHPISVGHRPAWRDRDRRAPPGSPTPATAPSRASTARRARSLGTTKVGRDPRQLAFGNGFVWVTNNDDNSVTRLDPQTGRVVGAPIPVGQRPLGVASGAGAVWVANHGDHTITRINP